MIDVDADAQFGRLIMAVTKAARRAAEAAPSADRERWAILRDHLVLIGDFDDYKSGEGFGMSADDCRLLAADLLEIADAKDEGKANL